MGTDRPLDGELLGTFAELLAEWAPAVSTKLRPGLSEDEIVAGLASVGVTASSDAVTWWQFWDGPNELDRGALSHEAYLEALRDMHSEILPGFQFLSFEVCVRGVELNRRMVRQLARQDADEFEIEDFWPQTWIPLFVDGGGLQVVLDCRHPDEPSALRSCFREDFSGPHWGKIVSSSMARWVTTGIEWMRRGNCRYEAEQRRWTPQSAFDDVWPAFESELPQT